VAKSLVDIVSKNGNLMLNIPVRGDGSIDEDEHKFLAEFGRWMSVHGEAIYGTRPFKIYGEGAPDVSGSHNFNETKARAFDASDIRFTTKGDVLYAFVLGWPADGKVSIKSLATNNATYPRKIGSVEMLGGHGRLEFRQEAEALTIKLPAKPQDHLDVYAFRILA
jgi:alpha-L-fucosidase